jgi:predicted O-methyltransferase YrrM
MPVGRFIRGVASRTRGDPVPRARRRNLLEQYPNAAGMVVEMGDLTYRVSNMDPFELYCLSAIARIRKPKTIFELGTYDGTTTLWLAKTVPDAEVFTLDLPPELRSEWERATLSGPEGGDGLGVRFNGTPYAAQITQLIGDSRSFDFSDYFGRMDLVLVDADHSYESARSDTENALRMVSPEGAVVWDDYDGWPGVVQAVDEAAERYGFSPVRIIPTELAVYDRAASGPTAG